MRRASSILRVIAAGVIELFRLRVAGFISILLMLLGVVYFVAIVMITLKWLGGTWLLLTVPLALILAFPALKLFAKWSQQIQDV